VALARVEGAAGGGADDSLLGGARTNVLVGGAGDDLLDGRGGGDKLFGGAGADVLIGGPGDDLMAGGRGADVFRVSRASDDVLVDYDPARDRIDIGGRFDLADFDSNRDGVLDRTDARVSRSPVTLEETTRASLVVDLDDGVGRGGTLSLFGLTEVDLL
jgi:Ca2+-binding RTX toxin-like protein